MRRTLLIFGAITAVGAFVASASAGVITNDPTLTVTAGGETFAWNLTGGPDVENEDGSWNYGGQRTENAGGGSWTLDYDINASRHDSGETTARAAQLAFVTNNLVMTNNTGATQTIVMTTMIPVAPGILPSSLMGGSASGTLTATGAGGSMSNVNGADSMYRAMIDGLFVGGVADLHNFDSSVSVVGFGSESTGFEDFGTPIPSAPGPGVNSSIGITIQFDLTDGDSASWTSVFAVNQVPAPGAGAVFALAGVFGIRRRR